MRDVTTERLSAIASRHLGRPAHARDLRRLTGGASRETWAFELADGDRVSRLILGRDSGDTPLGLSRENEWKLLEAAGRTGVPAPTTVFPLDTADGLGPGYVMDFIEGETIPRKILRDKEYARALRGLAAQCGTALAHIHAIDTEPLAFLRRGDQLDQYRQLLDGFGEPHPAFELGIRWLERHPPPSRPPRLVHGDFRHGNLLIGPDGLRAVPDWELAHVGDPMEDLGWLCMRAWRFGHDNLPVGGFGTREDLFAAYEAAGGGKVDPEVVRYWEVFGNLRWGVICLVQCFTHLNHVRRSVELAAIGRRVSETEYDLLTVLEEVS